MTVQPENRVVALGFFDGVHRGHCAILRRAAELARERGWGSAAVTFQAVPLGPGFWFLCP